MSVKTKPAHAADLDGLIQIKALVLACSLNSESNWNYPNTAQQHRQEDFMLEQAKIVASDIMTHDVAVVHPDTTLLDALKVMASHRISGLPVVDEQGTLVGMMSEGDVLGWHEGFSAREARWFDLLAEGFDLAPDFLREIQEQHRKIKAVMSSNPITVTETTPAREIASLMHAHGIKRVPVMRDGKLVGIISRADLVRALIQKLSEIEPAEPRPSSVNEALRLAREEAIADIRKELRPVRRNRASYDERRNREYRQRDSSRSDKSSSRNNRVPRP